MTIQGKFKFCSLGLKTFFSKYFWSIVDWIHRCRVHRYRGLTMIVQKEHHGGPVVKKPAFQCRGCRFDSWSGNWDPTCHSVLQLLSPGTTRKMLHASEKLLCATTETQCGQTETATCFLEKEERKIKQQEQNLACHSCLNYLDSSPFSQFFFFLRIYLVFLIHFQWSHNNHLFTWKGYSWKSRLTGRTGIMFQKNWVYYTFY